MSRQQRPVHIAHYIVFFIVISLINIGALIGLLAGPGTPASNPDGLLWLWQLASALAVSVGLPLVDSAATLTNINASNIETSGAGWLYEEMLFFLIAAIAIVSMYYQGSSFVMTLLSFALLQLGPWVAFYLSRQRSLF